MKHIPLFILIIAGLTTASLAQTNNSYPTSGNVKIFGTDEAWAEGLSIVKPSGWSGIRLNRNNPASGNFEGNWALGYNANTGNDFSISNNTGNTQYDYLFHISSATRNVGIGTSSPGSKFNVFSTDNTTPVKAIFGSGTSPTTLYSSFNSQTNSAIEINSNSGQSYGGPWLILSNSATPNAGSFAAGIISFTLPSTAASEKRAAVIVSETSDNSSSNISANLRFYTNNSGSLAERMRIDPNGYVGIGTSSPAYNMDIASGLRVGAGNPGGAMILLADDATIFDDQDGDTRVRMNHGGNFKIDNGGFAVSGNVAIGTTNPQGYKLSVAGNMIAESVKVKLVANWPDYVFSTNHSLRSLSDLEKFIQTNKHLPEIPSAEEVSKDGIELGEMNAKLLKKIEELTLYMIQLKKELDEVKAAKN